MEQLREQVMINQFVQVTGSGREQAAEILSTAQWQLQAALSRYFDDTVTPYRSGGGGIPWGTPSNTPATPPNFGEALAAFSALSTAQGCKLATSPLAQAPRQYLPMSPPNQPLFSPPSKNLPLPQRHTEMSRVRHDSEVQGGGKVAVRGEEVKPTVTGNDPMREGERDLPMPDQEFEMELEN